MILSIPSPLPDNPPLTRVLRVGGGKGMEENRGYASQTDLLAPPIAAIASYTANFFKPNRYRTLSSGSMKTLKSTESVEFSFHIQ